MEEKNIRKILSDLKTGYDLIAEKFSGTRAFMWRDLEFIKDYVKPDYKILDFGCGNGRLAGFLDDNYKEFVGVDISQKLINLAKQRYSSEKTKFIKVNPLFDKLLFIDKCFDAVFSIAVFHHIPTEENRIKVAKELQRVLKPGGILVISVWNLWQKRFWKYHLQEFKNKILGRSELDWGDIWIPFKKGEEVFQRYHHAFTEKELERFFRESGFKEIKNLSSGRNIIIKSRK